MSGRSVLAEHTDGVCVISLNRPARHNALDDEAGALLAATLSEAIGDPQVRCILLSGEGPSFCSGRDTRHLGERVAGESDLSFVRRAQRARLETLSSPKPVIAACRGYALGGGFELALSADFRIASTDAVFGLPEIGFGLVPDTGGTQVLTSLIGPSKTKYLVMTGERIDAATALAWGVVDFVVEPEALDEHARGLAARLAAAPPQAVSMAKLLVDQAWAGSIRNGITQELLAQVALFAGEEHRVTKEASLAQARAAKDDS